MRRYPPITIHRYLDLPSIQRIQTHTGITPPHHGPSPISTPHLHHPHNCNQKKQTHVQHSPCSHRIDKAQTQSSHPPTPPRAKHIHISHTPHLSRTTLIHNTSDALDTMPEARVRPTCPALTTPHPSPTSALPSTSHHHTLSENTHATQTTVHASQSHQPPHPHRAPRQPHRQTKDDHMTTDTTQ